MVISVLAIVTVLTLIVMGYKLGDDGAIEQAGLVQFSSVPTGARVEIDDGALTARTNSSKMLSDGQHKVKMTRDGYDSWEREIKVKSGWLLRLTYPRLFLTERETELVKTLPELEFLEMAPARTSILYAAKDAVNWQWMSIRDNENTVTQLEMGKILPGVAQGKFNGEIKEMSWDKAGEKVLVEVEVNGARQWILVNLRDAAASLNLTKEFGMDFSTVVMAEGNADRLWVLEKQNLREVNVGERRISRVLIEGVESFDDNGADLIYVTRQDVQGRRSIGMYQAGRREVVTIKQVEDGLSARAVLCDYYGDKYLVMIIGGRLYVYKGDYPAAQRGLEAMELLIESDTDVVPEGAVEVNQTQQVMVAHQGDKFVAVDLEMGGFWNYTAENQKIEWLDDYILYGVKDGKLLIWDFDGTNRRELVGSDVAIDAKAVVSKNNRWLYYVRQGENGKKELIREKILN